jgi:glycosyltransferase involved in cell wall biosynthesis
MPVSTSEHPLVSVLIPAYNHDQFVEQCLRSALEEPYPNKELIVIDDGSTDGTAKTISAWIARHCASIPIDFTSRANKGVSATLNELASRAKGQFLRLGASDDYLLPGGLRAQVEYLLANPRKLAVIGDSVVVGERGETLYQSAMTDLHRVKKSAYLSDRGIRRQVIRKWAVGGPVPMIRKEAFEFLDGWSEDLRIEDWDFFLRLVARDALGFIDVKVGCYRVHSRNTCRTDDIAARLANLGDAARTAQRHIGRFDEPCRTLLVAQHNLIAAKIAFLQKKPLAVAANMMRFMFLSLASIKKAGRTPVARTAP